MSSKIKVEETAAVRSPQEEKHVVLAHWQRTECGSLEMPKELTALVIFFADAIIDSQILSPREFIALNDKVLDKCNVDLANCKLLFQGSNDGFAAATFHELCDGKSPTLTVVLTEFGHIVGGFTTVAWDSSAKFSNYKCDSDAWLFVSRMHDSRKCLFGALKLPVILSAKSGSGSQVCHRSEYGPTFGAGHDLHIGNESSLYASSLCHCTGQFSFTNECDGLALSCEAIAGSQNFRVVNYEVFLVQ